MYADENVIKIKHDVLYTVAKLAFEGRLEEERDTSQQNSFQVRHRSFAVVFIKRGRSSVRESV